MLKPEPPKLDASMRPKLDKNVKFARQLVEWFQGADEPMTREQGGYMLAAIIAAQDLAQGQTIASSIAMGMMTDGDKAEVARELKNAGEALDLALERALTSMSNGEIKWLEK